MTLFSEMTTEQLVDLLTTKAIRFSELQRLLYERKLDIKARNEYSILKDDLEELRAEIHRRQGQK